MTPAERAHVILEVLDIEWGSPFVHEQYGYYDDAEAYITDAIQQAVEAEREACAYIVRRNALENAEYIEREIRARGAK